MRNHFRPSQDTSGRPARAEHDRLTAPQIGNMKRRGASEWPWIAAVILIAAVVYRPWEPVALPLTDFGTFLPLLDSGDSVLSQLVAVTKYYIDEGRLCLLQYLLVVLAGNAFGMWAPGWYMTYFALNAIVIVVGWLVLRRAGMSRAASFLGLAFWATMSTAPEAWNRPTGEPIALILFLVALYNAINFTTAANWRSRIAIIALCSLGIIFSKELLVVLLPAGWLMSRLEIEGGEWRWAPWSRRDSLLLMVTAATIAAAMIPVGYVALTAPEGNYAAQFGSPESPWKLVLRRLEMVLIPTLPALGRLTRIMNDPGWILLLVLPAFIWIRMIAGGLAAGGRKLLWPVVIAVVWFSLGIASYVPWPGGDAFYMMPFAFGAMFGAAAALDSMMRSSPVAKAGVLAVSSLLLLVTSVESNTVVQRYRLRATLNGALVANIADGGHTQTLVAAVRERPDEERWGWARNLQGFVKFASGTTIGESRDLTCSEARRALDEVPGLLIISRERGCGRLSGKSVAIDRATYRSQWPWLWERHIVTDRIYVTRNDERVVTGTSPVGTMKAPL
jgi:hypothetical protein